MRKVIVSTYMTLDGVMTLDGDMGQKWHFPYWNDELGKYAVDQLFASDALLLGRRTYEIFAASWPSVTDEQGFADRMNSLPKYVVSTTLEKAEWNNSTIIKGNVAEEVSKLKQQPGQAILMYGSAELMHMLMHHGLIDEFRLWVHPVVLGSGKRLFQDGSDTTVLTPMGTTTFTTGVTILSYQLASKPAES